jgi:succinate-semialdehyde dehydrogenase/glutarate-semialdehyde dehydrogenase
VSITTTNPATGKVVRTFKPLTQPELDKKLALAADASAKYKRTSFAQRADRMRAAAGILEKEKRRFGEMMTLEMGKPFTAAIAEAEKCAGACRYYADNAESFLADRKIEVGEDEAWITHQPIGAVLAVMPWNFPFWQVFRFAAPALMAGNVGLLKHASNVPQCALAIEDIFDRAGFERGVFQTLLIGSGQVAAVIADPRVAAVTLTGSEGAGRSVAEQAGRNLKKTVLELGGSDPFVVMPSADLDAAVSTAVTARMINNGQSCIAAKRFIVHEAIYESFISKFVAAVEKVRVGDPMDESTALGPLATGAIRDELHRQVEQSVAAGARLLTGGKPRAGAGFYYEPTVLDRIPANAPAAQEELFGPVASVFRAASIDDAIAIANSTHFGLGASAWTSDSVERAKLVAGIESGMVFINEMVASDARLPFGGVKSSGYGRELSDIGIREFVNIKTVRVAATKRRPAKSSLASRSRKLEKE